MKRIGLLSSMLGAGLLQLLAHGGGWKDVGRTAAAPRSHRNVGRFSSYLYRPTARTTEARHWHNPADPVQAARIEAAAAKRERKSQVLRTQTALSRYFNTCHKHSSDFDSLNPQSVAK